MPNPQKAWKLGQEFKLLLKQRAAMEKTATLPLAEGLTIRKAQPLPSGARFPSDREVANMGMDPRVAYGADPSQRDYLAQALSMLLDTGRMDPSILKAVRGMGIHNPGRTGGYAAYWPNYGLMTFSDMTTNQNMQKPHGILDTSRHMAHEFAHGIDRVGTGNQISKNTGPFAYEGAFYDAPITLPDLRDVTVMMPKGSISREITNARYPIEDKINDPVAAIMNYPRVYSPPNIHLSDPQTMHFLGATSTLPDSVANSEELAQIYALYLTAPERLKATMPKAYAFVESAGMPLDAIRTKWASNMQGMKAGGPLRGYGAGGKIKEGMQYARGFMDDLVAEIQRYFLNPAIKSEVSTTKPPYLLQRPGTDPARDMAQRRVLGDEVTHVLRGQLPGNVPAKIKGPEPIRGLWRNSEGALERNPGYSWPTRGYIPSVEADRALKAALADIGALGDQDAASAVRFLPRGRTMGPKSNAVRLDAVPDPLFEDLAAQLGDIGAVVDTPTKDVLVFPFEGKPDQLQELVAKAREVAPGVPMRFGRSDPGIDRTFMTKPPNPYGPDYSVGSAGYGEPWDFGKRVAAVRRTKERARPR